MIRAGRSRDGQQKSAGAGTSAPDNTVAAAPDNGTATQPDNGTATQPDDAVATQPAEAAVAPSARVGVDAWAAIRRASGKTWLRHFSLLLIYELAGIAATWPRFTYLADSKLPATQDVSTFVWDLWWVAHRLVHPGNPFFTSHMAAPVGIQLGFSTLMPLVGWLMSPITVGYGPSATFTLLTIVTPGLLCYVMYRAARLWLNIPGSVVAGAFFGLSSMLLWQNWYHINIAMGTIFLPITLEAAVRLRRKPGNGSAIALGLALGASILINQESTVVAIALAAAILIPWLVGMAIRDRSALRLAVWPVAVGALIAIVVASPQLIAMFQQVRAGEASPPPGQLALNNTLYGATLPSLFAPSPRLATFGLAKLAAAYSYNQPAEGLPTFGIVLSVLALLGLAVGWRRRSTWWFLALWFGGAVLALGTSLTFGKNCVISATRPGIEFGRSCHQYLPLLSHTHWALVTPATGRPFWAPVAVSNLMPYTWLVRIPGLSSLREADRFALVGLVGAAMLAGLTVQWLSRRTVTRPLIAVVIALGVFEAGWSGASGLGYSGTMATTMPRLDHLLVRDHAASIVVDFPFGLRGGVSLVGSRIAPQALLISTHDEHPRAISYTAWVSGATRNAIERHPFYNQLLQLENGTSVGSITRSQLTAARADLRAMDIGWIVEWRDIWTRNDPGLRYSNVDKYFKEVGLRHVVSICIQGPGIGCPTQDQAWLYRPGNR